MRLQEIQKLVDVVKVSPVIFATEIHFNYFNLQLLDI